MIPAVPVHNPHLSISGRTNNGGVVAIGEELGLEDVAFVAGLVADGRLLGVVHPVPQHHTQVVATRCDEAARLIEVKRVDAA